MRLLDEVVQHLLGDFEVSDDAVFHGLDSDNVARGTAKHLLGFFAHGFDFTGVLVDGDDGRFVDYDALAAGINQRVRGSQIDGKIAGKHAEQRTHVAESRGTAMKTVR